MCCQLGDIVDARDETMGAWFEAKIIQISKAPVKQSAKEASNASHNSDPMDTDQNENTITDSVKQEDCKVDVVIKENTTENKQEVDMIDTKLDDLATSVEEHMPTKSLLEDKMDDGFLYHIVYNGQVLRVFICLNR